MREKFDLARKRLRDKLGLTAATASEIAPSAASSDGSGSAISVLDRVLAFEDHSQATDVVSSHEGDMIPLPAALSHSLSGTWRQYLAGDGKPVWHRDTREAASIEVSRLETVARNMCICRNFCSCIHSHRS